MRRAFRCRLVSCVVIGLLGTAEALAGPKGLISYVSDPGDYIGQGEIRAFTPLHGTFTASRTFDNGIEIRFSNFEIDPIEWWSIHLAAPMKAVIVPGTYENATRWPFQEPESPGLDFSGSGRGCNQLGGRFVVHDVAYGTDGTVLRLNADLEQHCEFAVAGLRAHVFYSATAPPRGDRNWDGRSELTVFRPSSGMWHSLLSGSTTGASLNVPWGTAGDTPVPADFDGDGATDLAVFRGGVWYVLFSSQDFSTWLMKRWGVPSDRPVPADYDGDGCADFAVFQPSTGLWFISHAEGETSVYVWGQSGDIPVPADYDGDGRADLAVFRPASGTWFVLTSSSGFTLSTAIPWGMMGDVPVVADYDGDGRADYAVYRPAPGIWYVNLSSTGFTSFLAVQWGAETDIVVPTDYDGDRLSDFAVFRPSLGMWFVRGQFAVPWGLNGDLPENGR